MKFFIPADFIEKSEQVEGEMRIRGYASTPNLDRDNETIVQNGLDIEDFINYGFFNYDHDNSIILGYPDKEKTCITSKGFYVEGTLLNTQRAKDIWETAVQLQKSNAPRRLGFSVEGRVIDRDKGGKIRKAKVTNVAITSTPVNPEATWEAIVKSLSTSALGIELGEALITESLEGFKTYTNQVEEKNKEAMQSLGYLREKLNKSADVEDVKLYLMMFKGLYGKDLDYKLNEVLSEMNTEKP